VTASDLIYSALRIAGILRGPDRTPSDSEINDALKVLNSLLDSWSIERLLIWSFQRNLYPLTASKQDYSIAPGLALPDWDAVRPVRIEMAGLFLTDTGLELPVRVLTVERWKEIPLKSVASTLPLRLYYEAAFPVGIVHVYPVPTIANQMVLYAWPQVLAQVETADAVMFLPPAYQRCLEYNLAKELSVRYPQFKLSPLALQIADESKSAIKSLNAPTLEMECDPALLVGGNRWNWMSGESI
jgi:hypothetical protein